MRYVTHPASAPLRGELAVPTDKSLSHRAVLFAAMAEGTSEIDGVLDSADVRSTISAVARLGAQVTEVPRAPTGNAGMTLRVTGWGSEGPHEPDGPIDCGNSGTTARVLLGVLAGWEIDVVLAGDESLSKRPMGRVTTPLGAMGAAFETTDGTLPVRVRGGRLTPIEFESPVASAQVKTAVLLAGLRASGRTLVREPAPSRDHTERLLPSFGVPVGRDTSASSCWVDGPARLRASDVSVPGDPSSAAFFAAAACLVPGSHVLLGGVGLNPTRTGFLRVLDRMGANVTVVETGSAACAGEQGGTEGEPVGRIVASYSATLHGTTVTADEVPALIDEIPILALVATQAEGTTRFESVSELRVKESDRLKAIEGGLAALGARTESGPDWLEVHGPSRLRGAELSSLGDHRLAMTWAVAGLIAGGAVAIEGFEAVEVSYPGFAGDLESLAGVR